MKLSKDGKTIILLEKEDIDENGYFKVPDGIKKLGNGKALCNVDTKNSLKVIDINDVTNIDCLAFSYFMNLKEVIGSPAVIGQNSFMFCKSLCSFDFSKTITISSGAFRASGLTEVNLCNMEIVAVSAFYYCSNLKRVKGAPKIIGGGAFNGCIKLKDFDFSNLEILGDEAFTSSGLRDNISATNKIINIKHGECNISFSRYYYCHPAYRIHDVISIEDNLYTDKYGQPFILTVNDKCVYLNKDKEGFLSLLNNKE